MAGSKTPEDLDGAVGASVLARHLGSSAGEHRGTNEYQSHPTKATDRLNIP